VRGDFTLVRPVIMRRLPFAAEAAGGAAGGAGGGAGAGCAPTATETVVGSPPVREDDGSAEVTDADAPAAAAAMAEAEVDAPAAGGAAVEADAPAAGGAGDALPGKLAR
jgi:hypothetical protein